MSEKKSFYQKVADLQAKIKVKKDNNNNFGGYKYRTLEDICAEIKPNLNGLVLYLNDELVNIGERYYIKATATITDGEHKISNSSLAREETQKKGMDGAQITGGSSSYARKYALSGLFLLENEKDSDATNKHEKTNYSSNKPIQTKQTNTPDYFSKQPASQPQQTQQTQQTQQQQPQKSSNNTSKPASEKQLALLRKLGVDFVDNNKLNSTEASKLIGNAMK